MESMERDDKFTPSREFIDRMEREIHSAARRTRAFAGGTSSRPSRLRLGLIVAVVALGSVTLGATGTLMMTAPARGAYHLALKRAEIALALARESESFVDSQRNEVAQLVERGAAPKSDLDAWDIRVIDATELRQLRDSQLSEVQYRRAPAVDEVTADRPAGRDFTRERLEIRRDATRLREGVLVLRVDDMEALVRAGAASPSALSEMAAPLDRERIEIRRLEQLIELRDRFNAGAVTASRAELEALRLEYAAERDRLAGAERRAEEHLQRVARLVERSVAAHSELRAAEHEHRLASLQRSSASVLIDAIDAMVAELPERDGSETEAEKGGDDVD